MILYVVVISVLPNRFQTKRFGVLPVECIFVGIKDLRRKIILLHNGHCFVVITKMEYIYCMVWSGVLNVFLPLRFFVVRRFQFIY